MDRNEKIQRIVKSVNKLNELFRQMNKLVIDQGTILDRIDFNIENTVTRTKKAKEELVQVLIQFFFLNNEKLLFEFFFTYSSVHLILLC